MLPDYLKKASDITINLQEYFGLRKERPSQKAKPKVVEKAPLKAKQTITPPKETVELQPDVEGKGPAAKRSEILRTFQEKFKTPIRVGKFRHKAGGIFKPDYKVVRLKNANDVEVAAHEIGHALSYQLWEMQKAISKAVRPYMHELKPISRYAPYS